MNAFCGKTCDEGKSRNFGGAKCCARAHFEGSSIIRPRLRPYP
jgi:hypothetical protein